jgi:hypothetical protein
MMETRRHFLEQMGLPPGDLSSLPSSPKRFPDGAQYRVEIPSTEGAAALAAIIEEAERYSITIHRVSQGSGVMLLTDDEIQAMARLAAQRRMEVSLFARPHAAWDTGAWQYPVPEARSAHVCAGKSNSFIAWKTSSVRQDLAFVVCSWQAPRAALVAHTDRFFGVRGVRRSPPGGAPRTPCMGGAGGVEMGGGGPGGRPSSWRQPIPPRFVSWSDWGQIPLLSLPT